MKKVIAIGEVMVELAPAPEGFNQGIDKDFFGLSFAGDTFNTAVYLARLGICCDYLTRLGDDVYSKKILAFMQSENLGSKLIEKIPGRCPGLYIINNSPDGEREFFYWRRESPARELFSSAQEAEILEGKLLGADMIYFSAISLAIISEQSRENLFRVLKHLRKEKIRIAFDTNYRTRLWPSKEVARPFIRKAIELSDVVLINEDDEVELWGDASLAAISARYSDADLKEFVVKRGFKSALVRDHQTIYEIPAINNHKVVDTTGAGDSFGAAYLAARLTGASPEVAAAQAHTLASLVIQHRGAILEKSLFEKHFR